MVSEQPTSKPTPGGVRLRGLFVCQFFGAFNDNAWKMFVALVMMHSVVTTTEGHGGLDAHALQQRSAAVCFVVFTLPLLMVSLPAGVVADRVPKHRVIRLAKGLELLLMAAATALLYRWPHHTTAMMVILGLMGFQSAVFSPAKYGILPELLNHQQLAWGNGLLEMWTFIAIIAGTAAGGALLDLVGGHHWLVAAALTVSAAVGLAAATGVPKVPAARQGGGVGEMVRVALTVIRGDRVLYLAVAGSVLYWCVASLTSQTLLVYAHRLTRGMDHADLLSVLPLGLLGLGVGGGSLLAGRWSSGKVEYGLIPLGTIAMSLFMLVLGTAQPGLGGTLVLMVLLGVASGLVVVPLNAILQWRSPTDRRGGIIATTNVAIFAGMLAGSLAGYYLSLMGLDTAAVLVAASVLVIAAAVWALRLLPVAAVRLVLVGLTHTFYRLRVVGQHHLPASGGALLVPNHVSFVDGLMILASTDRPVRFVVDAHYYELWWLRPLMRMVNAIPIQASGGPRVILRALRQAGEHLDNGELVCIFPEGQITRTGALMPFRRGMARIVKGRSVPIVPVHLGGLWGSIFSYTGGRFITKWPSRIPYHATVSFGEPLASTTEMFEVRQAVMDLGRCAWQARQQHRPPLHRGFVRRCRRAPWRLAFVDSSPRRVTRLGALAGSIAMARALRQRLGEQRRVGILLPPSVAAAVVNLSAAVAGRTSVNLNYTAGDEGVRLAIEQAGLRTVVTHPLFLEKTKLTLPSSVTPLPVDELARTIGPRAKTIAFAMALVAPCRLIERYCGAKPAVGINDDVTVIFSSGSTGQPKGVPLTHANIDSNVEAVAQVFHILRGDRMLGILPHFHSFGYMTLWLAANHGIAVAFHPNPLDADAVGRLVAAHRLTVLIATPTFLGLYLKRCDPGAFGSLRIVLSGAERLDERLADAFAQTFGIRPIEGYGATECAPVIAVSNVGVRYSGIYQAGAKRGRVGLALPGVSVRVVDPESFEPLGSDRAGMLLVKGPNVTRGYLGRDDLTRQSFRDGWYITGDIAAIDDEGFIKITDRLSRFSKIGGEMIPHGKVEQALHDAAGLDTQAFAVTSLPDAKKGERLVVLHTHDEKKIPALLKKLSEAGLPNLFVPRANDFVSVDALPLLGSGKLDLRAVKQIANAKAG